MSRFGRYRWFVLAGGITLAFAVVSLTVPRGPVLTAISDVGYLLLYLAVAVAMLANAWSERGANRRFWALMGAGCILWASNQAAWVYCEVRAPHRGSRSVVHGCLSVSPPGSDDRGGWVASAPDRR